jgi:putative chitinase
MFDADTFRRLWPLGDKRISGLIGAVTSAASSVFAKYKADAPLVVAHAMAQFSHECEGGTAVLENLNYSADGLVRTWPTRFDADKAARFAYRPEDIANEVYNGRMGNRLNTDDGWTFRGRGASQTTGRSSYERLGEIVGLDLISHPELINDPAYFLECGVADFAIICGCIPPAEQDNIVKVTRCLNGGYIGLADRTAWLAKWKPALGI